MSSGSSQSNALANAEMERRGLRRVLYIVAALGLGGTVLGFGLPAGQIAGPIVTAVALAGLAASCRPIAA